MGSVAKKMELDAFAQRMDCSVEDAFTKYNESLRILEVRQRSSGLVYYR